MLGKFTKSEKKFVAEAQHTVREAVDALRDMIAREVSVESRDDLDEHILALKERHESAVEVCSDVIEFMITFVEEQQSQYDEKSERWQEGDRAQQVGSWIDSLTELAEFEAPPFEITESDITYTLSDDDDVHEGMPTTFPALVDLSGALYNDLESFADSLEGLPESADEM